MQERIGFFGGSFDPIHFGHLNLAVEIMEARDLNQVLFCPANINPHKLNQECAPINHRLEMVKLAISDNPNFQLLDVESKRKGPSYTIDTLSELIAKEELSSNPRKIFLLLSDEALPGFFKWHKPEEIVKMVPLLIGSRLPVTNGVLPEGINRSICDAIKKGWTITSRMDISSTAIRSRLYQRYCGHLLPQKVLDYIYQNHLYCSL
ncbi:MAG TPA: nicotinate (nicotinamide) nucleotide adenylyltransferase [Waddliaceae bacterium]